MKRADSTLMKRRERANIFMYFTAALLAALCIAQNSFALPSVDVTVEQQDNYHSLIFTFSQADLPSMEGCHYNLFAADDPKKLKSLPGGGRSIATFYKPLSELKIIASPLPHLSRKQGKHNPKIVGSAKVYFRVLLSCPEATSAYGEIFSTVIKTFRDGTQINVQRLTHDMKYNMQYYNPE